MAQPFRIALFAAALVVPAGAVVAHGWGGGWGGAGWDAPASPDRDGVVTSSVFRAEGAAAVLGHGRVAVAAMPAAREDGDEAPEGDAPRDPLAPAAGASLAPAAGDPFGREAATYQAAVVDRLARAGYQTALPVAAAAGNGPPAPAGVPVADQIAYVRIVHAEASPGDAPHRPVSGAMAVGVSNRGSGMALALNIDLSKPRGPLVLTRMDVRLCDGASGRALWEGHAEIATRTGDPQWRDDRIAGRLAAALFDGFPGRTGDRGMRD